MSDKPSLLEQKRAKTRCQLVAAARGLVFERQNKKISIQDVTDKAGLGLGTFYNYFETKTAVFEAVLSEIQLSFDEALKILRGKSADPATIVANSIQYSLLEAQDNVLWQAFLTGSGLKGDYLLLQSHTQCFEDIQRGCKSGRFKVDDVNFTAQLIMGMLRHVTHEINNGDLPRTAIPQTARHVLRMLGIPDPVAKALTQQPLPAVAAGKRQGSLSNMKSEPSRAIAFDRVFAKLGS